MLSASTQTSSFDNTLPSSTITSELIGQLPWWTAELNVLEKAYGQLMPIGGDSSRLATEARLSNNRGQADSSLTYGELPFRCLAHILQLPVIANHSHHFFYDLGSGVGRTVFAAHYLGAFVGCTGIEIVPQLHQVAEETLEYMQTTAAAWKGSSPPSPSSIMLQLGDITDDDMVWWQSSGIVYICSLCFTEELWEKVSQLCLQMPPGAILVTLRQHPSFARDSWQLAFQAIYEMSWGISSVYVYKVLSQYQKKKKFRQWENIHRKTHQILILMSAENQDIAEV